MRDLFTNLWKESKIKGGACGEIRTDLGKGLGEPTGCIAVILNIKCQTSWIKTKYRVKSSFHYGFARLFSAYRMEAVRLAIKGSIFTENMLKSEGLHFFSSNMYLVQIRILCFEIVVKRDYNWILKYCRSSYASTDVPGEGS